MCGIVGTIGRGGVRPAPKALEALAHRGPDGAGAFASGNLWLGHRRLSIIDLSEGAAQPMVKPGAGAIVFNGEIYDYRLHRKALQERGIRFESTSDTEVLMRGLALDGIKFLRRLHGMYALAWLEEGGKRLWLARDHVGMKPLYLWRGPGGLAFASEVRALAEAMRALQGAPRLNGRALGGFLSWGAVPEPECILDGVQSVPASTAIEVDLDDPSRLRSYGIATVESVGAPDGEAGVPRVVEAVRAAVRRHLEADTPVALFLSGGIDSSVLAAEISRFEGPRPTAISIVLGSRGTNDEPAIVRETAARLGLSLEQVPLQDWPDLLEGWGDAYDQPSIDGANTFLISTVARRLGFKVALSGVGADEVFGGYWHLHARLPRPAKQLLARLPVRWVAPILERTSIPQLKRIGMILDGEASGDPLTRSFRRIFSEGQVRALLPGLALPGWQARREDRLFVERDTYLKDTLLRDTDVMGMSRGLEIRAPYLDPAVLCAAEAIGSACLLATGRPSKWILREQWAAQLPANSLERAKTGFSLELTSWFRQRGRPILEDAYASLSRRPAIGRAAVEFVWRQAERRLSSGHPSAWVPLFALMQLEQQFRRWGDPV